MTEDEIRMIMATLFGQEYEPDAFVLQTHGWLFWEVKNLGEMYHVCVEDYDLDHDEQAEFAAFVLNKQNVPGFRLFVLNTEDDTRGVIGFKRQASGNVGCHLYIFPEYRKRWFNRSLIAAYLRLVKALYPDVRILASTSEGSVKKLLTLIGFTKFLSHGNVSNWYLEPIKEV